MSKLGLETDRIVEYFKKGMEEGSVPLVKAMPIILARLDELERTLIPFARVGIRDNKGLPLVQVYHSHCKNAYNVLSSAAAKAAEPPPEEWLPAEHV